MSGLHLAFSWTPTELSHPHEFFVWPVIPLSYVRELVSVQLSLCLTVWMSVLGECVFWGVGGVGVLFKGVLKQRQVGLKM